MFIIIKDLNNITKYLLKNDLIKYKGINIYFKNNNYYLNLNKGYFLKDNQKTLKLEKQKYEIITENTFYHIELYVYENDFGINDYSLFQNRDFIIAHNEKANIVCLDSYLKDKYLSIVDGYLKSNFEIIVNGNEYNHKRLSDGDRIEYLGITVYYFENFLYLNHFNIDIKLAKLNINEQLINYPEKTYAIKHQMAYRLNNFDFIPLKEFEENNRVDISKQKRTIISSFMMFLVMFVMAMINLYNSYLNDRYILNQINYLLMPLGILISSFILPLIFYLLDKYKIKKETAENINNYLEYLDDYKNKLLIYQKEFKEEYDKHYFDLTNENNNLFYVLKDSEDFLKLSVSRYCYQNNYDFKLTNIKSIDDKLKDLKEIINNIEDFPLFISLLDYPIITCLVKNSNKEYYFKKFILNLAFRHHFEDIKIAVYIKDAYFLDDFYHLPHLFLNEKRLIVSSLNEIVSLDQTKFNCPLVLFAYELFEYEFHNPNIYVFAFSDYKDNLFKNSKAYIDYVSNINSMYSDKHYYFNDVLKKIDFKAAFTYLSYFHKINNKNDYQLNNDFLNKINIENNYQNYNNTLLASFAYSGNNLLEFDLHESKNGPHGLIAGATGSGKTELIISMLLSLVINYPPDYLNIILIDYKGAGIEDSFTYDNKLLPHFIASVSNLDNQKIKRLIIALNQLCKKRQLLFNKASNQYQQSIMNIDDYLKYEKTKKMAHLLIVVDEFAELKKSHPQYIKDLISISRIGRSLGIHLILATQKPSGVVDDEIWANSRFKIALKVFDEKDSNDLLKRKDAVYLKNPGEFYLRLDDGLTYGKAIYCKSKINDENSYKVSLLDKNLNEIKTLESSKKSNTIISTCLKEISKLHYERNDFKFLSDEAKTIDEIKVKDLICFGQIDDYYNNDYALLSYQINEDLLIYSNRKEINNLIYFLNQAKRKMIIISDVYYKSSYISNSFNYDDDEDLIYLFDKLLMEDPNICLIIEDLNCLLSYNDQYLDRINKILKRKRNLNLIILSKTSQISFRILNYFKNKILINCPEQNEIYNFFLTKTIYESTSYFIKNEVISFVPLKLIDYNPTSSLVSSYIDFIPQIISADENEKGYLVGYETNTRKALYSKDFIIVSNDRSLFEYYKEYDCKKLIYQNDIKVPTNTKILWLGSGIFNQRLFYCYLKEDLTFEEALFINKGKQYKLRGLNA